MYINLFFFLIQLFKNLPTITKHYHSSKSPNPNWQVHPGILLQATEHTWEFGDSLVWTDVLHLNKNGQSCLNLKIISSLMLKVNGVSWGLIVTSGISHHRFWMTVHKLLWFLNCRTWKVFGGEYTISCWSQGRRRHLSKLRVVATATDVFVRSFKLETEQTVKNETLSLPGSPGRGGLCQAGVAAGCPFALPLHYGWGRIWAKVSLGNSWPGIQYILNKHFLSS